MAIESPGTLIDFKEAHPEIEDAHELTRLYMSSVAVYRRSLPVEGVLRHERGSATPVEVPPAEGELLSA